MDVCFKRRRGVDERVCLIWSLVPWLAELEPAGPESSRDTDTRDIDELILRVVAGSALKPAVAAEIVDHLVGSRSGPGRLGAPFPRSLQSVGVGTLVVLHVDDNRRFVHYPGILALAPMVEPPHRLVQVVDARSGHGNVRGGMV